METHEPAFELTPEQANTLEALMMAGAEMDIASMYLGVDLETLALAIDADNLLARRLIKAKAQQLLRHVKNVERAAADPRLWRASLQILKERPQVETTQPQLSTDRLNQELMQLQDDLVEVTRNDAFTRHELSTLLWQIINKFRNRHEL